VLGLVKHLKTLMDYDKEWILDVVDNAIKIKANQQEYSKILEGKTLGMLFMKTSTRTRCSFEAGMTQLGGHAMYLDWRTTNFTLGKVGDEIKCLDRYCDIIMARVYKHAEITAMADASKVPLINALCDRFHPCQILADLQTIKEKKGKLEGLTLAFIGDGNNVCNSLILGCTKVGMKIKVATPQGYGPDSEIVEIGKKSGLLELYNDPAKAVEGADVVYTDTWVSMGQEEEKEKKMKAFEGFQVSMALLNDNNAANAIVMHCLPAHRGYEISDDAMDSENSVVYDQAENRMHAQKAAMLKLLNKI
jgi:ornithine carbamoyltransferase